MLYTYIYIYMYMNKFKKKTKVIKSEEFIVKESQR